MTWFKGGQPIKVRPDDKRISIEVDGAEHLYVLEILEAAAADAGEYTITAVNAEGKIFHAISVDVEAKIPLVEEEIVEPEK